LIYCIHIYLLFKLGTDNAIVILTNHSNIDYEKIKNSNNLIIDTRNVYKNEKNNNIVRLGSK